ncbi:ATP-binding protein [Hymenobacter sp. GOD-10R]|uniref:hybrid sensor histidine kinase/response regulator n=1 Tax=Hymenobacter sp. GOD-10R TaxID=3093922 RepID=UPI002D76F8A9|nr:ATP-binding protein [Hymenobacter sp. GOD-10R]WRQ29576.1 ATP-binding protein [Hymenobacter sp. GOD-10R]
MVRYLLAVLLLIGLGLPVRGQQHYLKQFGAADGLPQPFIYALLQDRTGYLWIGTGEGLVRYDGTEFVTFTTKDGLAEDFITTLREEPRTGQLWVGHYQGGVSRWNGQRFAAVSSTQASFLQPRHGLPTPTNSQVEAYLRRYHPTLPTGTVISCLLPDREGNIWLGTAGQGLWRHADLHLAFYPNSLPLASAVIALSGKEVAVVGTERGALLSLLDSATDTRTLASVPAAVTALMEQPASSKQPSFYWVGKAGQGIWKVQLGQSAQPTSRLSSDLQATALALEADGSLWVGTSTDGLYRLPSQPERAVQHFTTANGLLHNSIKALLFDATGQLWIATHGTGLTVWKQERFQHYRLVQGGLDATALTTDKAGRVWIGTEGDGLFCYEKGRFRQYTAADGLPSDYCYAVTPFQLASSTAGAPGTEELLIVHRNSLTIFNPITHHFWSAASSTNPWVHDCLPFATTTRHQIWLGTRTGLLRLDVKHGSWAKEPRIPSVALLLAEVDGATRNPKHLGRLAAGQHRVTFLYRGVSLSGGNSFHYEYRLQGLSNHWSRSSLTGEAQFPALDPGNYTFEVRARSSTTGPWSKPTVVTFSIATPFWRTAWFGTAAVAALVLVAYGLMRAREATLRRQKLQLETTVRKRTARLRRQKAHIEDINEELIVARDAAEASRKAKAQFLANMSHEIRTPMNAVIGLTHLLRNTAPTTEQAEYLTAIQSSSQNLLVIINDILDSSKIEAGKLTLEHAPFNLPELLGRVARMFEFATATKGLSFHLHIAPEVPAAVFGDSVRLNQVLVNLVGNAVKFTTHGSVTLTATTRPTAADTALVYFAVADTGIGIAADKLEAIFEDFSQANTSTTRQFGGTGLGLSIARNIVHLHGGRLWVESQEALGSIFQFEIPYAVADITHVRPEGVADLRPFEPALRVLVAEDNELNQLVARKTLEAWNVQVTIADNGRLAVEAAQLAPYDAILMDVQMPEMDGYEASRQLRMHFPDAQALPIIGLTASALPEDRALALAAGMNDTLAKPFDPALLYARIAYYTGRTQAEASETETNSQPQPVADLAPPPAPSLDWTLLDELAGGNTDFTAQLIRTVLQQAPPLLAELKTAAEINDQHTLARTAHKLKGQVAYFGALSLQSQLETLEHQARQPEAEIDFSAAISNLTGQWLSIVPQLEARLHASLAS